MTQVAPILANHIPYTMYNIPQPCIVLVLVLVLIVIVIVLVYHEMYTVQLVSINNNNLSCDSDSDSMVVGMGGFGNQPLRLFSAKLYYKSKSI